MSAGAVSEVSEAGRPDDYLYFRWAGFLLRHPAGHPDRSEILKALQWMPAPSEAVSDICELPEDHPPGGWCTRLSRREAARMAASFGVSL
jgi:hypothetical protein